MKFIMILEVLKENLKMLNRVYLLQRVSISPDTHTRPVECILYHTVLASNDKLSEVKGLFEY